MIQNLPVHNNFPTATLGASFVPPLGLGQANSNFAYPQAQPALGFPAADGAVFSPEAMAPEAAIGGFLSALAQAFAPPVDPVTMLQQQIAQVQQQLGLAQAGGNTEMAMTLTQQLQMLMAQLAQMTGSGGAESPMAGAAEAPMAGSASGGGAGSSGGGAAPPNFGGGGGGASSGGGGGSVASGSAPSSFPLDSSYSSEKASPGVSAMLDHAGSMVGLHEGRDTAAIQKITGKTGINPATTPWCAAWAMNLMRDHGVLDLDGLKNPNYCPEIKNWASGKGNYGKAGQYNPKPGDAILFDWQKDGTTDHIGIVEKVVNGKVYTIEGNSSDSVKRNSYPLNSGSIDGYVKSKPQSAAPASGGAKKTTAA